MSPARPGGFSNGEEPLFKNLALIARDRPHRYRSVQKGFWSHVGLEIRELLDSLVVGPRSLARLMETSRKFSLLFEKKQRESKARNVHDAPAFAGVLRNLQFSESRFSSRTKPLFRLFRLLPEVIQTLAEISSWKAQAEKDEADWATALLEKWGGDKGYEALVSAAVLADSLIASQPALRLEDEASADYALSGAAAAELKMSLEALLLHGGLFLPEAEGTLTHHCLRAIQNKTVFVKSGSPNASAVALRWPAPGSSSRKAPIEKAKQQLNIGLSFEVSVLVPWSVVTSLKGLFCNPFNVKDVRDLCCILQCEFPHVRGGFVRGFFSCESSSASTQLSQEIK